MFERQRSFASLRMTLWRVRLRACKPRYYRALPAEGEVTAAVRTAYAGLLDPAVEPRLGDLGEMLLGGLPLEPPPEVLWIVPSGILHALPFEALPAGGGRQTSGR